MPLKDIISCAITPDIRRAIYLQYKRFPENDADFLNADLEVGIIEEEIALSAAQILTSTRMDSGKKDSVLTIKYLQRCAAGRTTSGHSVRSNFRPQT